jgi:hypothetical protein
MFPKFQLSTCFLRIFVRNMYVENTLFLKKVYFTRLLGRNEYTQLYVYTFSYTSVYFFKF